MSTSPPSDPLGGVLDGALDVHEATFKWGDASAADLLAAGIKHVGEDPNVVVKKTDENGDPITKSVWDIVPDHMELPNAVRRLRNHSNVLGGGPNKRDIIAYAAWKFLTAGGQFFMTANKTVYYFYDEEKKVYRVSGDGNNEVTQQFRALVHELTGLSTGQDGRASLTQIHDRAMRTAPEREAHRFAAWDDDGECLYVTDFNDGYYALDGTSIEHRDNGDDVFFLDFDGEPYTYLDPSERASFADRVPGELDKWHKQGDLLMRFFGNRLNFDPSAILAPEQQRLQMYVHLHAMALIDYFTAKPITAFVGEKGSGKTVIQRSVGKFLFGENWTESMMPSEREDFAAIVNNRPLAFVDNFDSAVDWANDILASVATGSADIRRELYTTMDMAKMNPDCFMAITSRDPPFRRDDVADRTIVFRVTRLDNFIGMRGFLNPVTRNRDSLWSVYLDNLNGIVEGMRGTNLESMVSTHRMSDWAAFAKVVGDVLEEDGVDDMLEVMQKERALFALEDDPLFRTVREWLNDKGGEVRGENWTAGNLLNELDDFAEENNIDFTYQRAQTLGKRLGNVAEEMDELFGFEVDDSNRTKQYRFIDPNSAKGRQGFLGYGQFDDDGDDDNGGATDATEDDDNDDDSGNGGATDATDDGDGGGGPDQPAPPTPDETPEAPPTPDEHQPDTDAGGDATDDAGGDEIEQARKESDHNQQERFDAVIDYISTHEGGNPDGVARADIVVTLHQRGYDGTLVKNTIDNLCLKGKLYEPVEEEKYRTT